MNVKKIIKAEQHLKKNGFVKEAKQVERLIKFAQAMKEEDDQIDPKLSYFSDLVVTIIGLEDRHKRFKMDPNSNPTYKETMEEIQSLLETADPELKEDYESIIEDAQNKYNIVLDLTEEI